jgi:hypothetical protein
MNNQIGNRDKRIAVLLIAAFAWLFIGSLIIFHEEHVLGKHFSLNAQLFISPKSSDKKDLSFNIQKSLLKFQDHGSSAGLPENGELSGTQINSCEFRLKAATFQFPGDVYLRNSSLRAPPVA